MDPQKKATQKKTQKTQINVFVLPPPELENAEAHQRVVEVGGWITLARPKSTTRTASSDRDRTMQHSKLWEGGNTGIFLNLCLRDHSSIPENEMAYCLLLSDVSGLRKPFINFWRNRSSLYCDHILMILKRKCHTHLKIFLMKKTSRKYEEKIGG